jgi:hypothetical protein
MVISHADDGQTGSFYDGIRGFRFQWGYRQTLRVERRRILNPPADGSSTEYALIEVLKKEAVPDWAFRAYLLDSSALSLSGDTLTILGYARPIRVEATEDREKLTGRSAAYRDIRLRPSPGTEGSDSAPLLGDSVRILRPDPTGKLIPE